MEKILIDVVLQFENSVEVEDRVLDRKFSMMTNSMVAL